MISAGDGGVTEGEFRRENLQAAVMTAALTGDSSGNRFAIADCFPQCVFVLFQSHEIRGTEVLAPGGASHADNALFAGRLYDQDSSTRDAAALNLAFDVHQRDSSVHGVCSPTAKHSRCFTLEGEGSFGGFAHQNILGTGPSGHPTA